MRVAVWGTGSSARSVMEHLAHAVEVVQIIQTSEASQPFYGLPVQAPDELRSDVDELWICSMWYPEILSEAVRLGVALENIRIFEDHLLTPGVPFNEVDPTSVMSLMPLYEAHAAVRRRVMQACEKATEVASRNELLRVSVQRAPADGLRIEFGVFEGASLLALQSMSETPVWGIDTFTGFDEDSPAYFGQESRKENDSKFPIEANAYCIKGRFQEVLEPFLASRQNESVTFVHYDAADLDAVRFVLGALASRLSADAVIVFDELIPHPHDIEAPEWTALTEFLAETDQPFRPFARCGSSVAALVDGIAPERV